MRQYIVLFICALQKVRREGPEKGTRFIKTLLIPTTPHSTAFIQVVSFTRSRRVVHITYTKYNSVHAIFCDHNNHPIHVRRKLGGFPEPTLLASFSLHLTVGTPTNILPTLYHQNVFDQSRPRLIAAGRARGRPRPFTSSFLPILPLWLHPCSKSRHRRPHPREFSRAFSTPLQSPGVMGCFLRCLQRLAVEKETKEIRGGVFLIRGKYISTQPGCMKMKPAASGNHGKLGLGLNRRK